MEAMTMGERRRIMALYEKGWRTSRIAEAIGRSKSGVRRVKQHFKQRGHFEPLPRGAGRPPTVTQADRQHLAELVELHPDATLDELTQRSGLPVSRATIDRHLRSLHLTLKKRRSTLPSRTARTSPSGATIGG